MLRKSSSPFIRDVYQAYLINGANRTKTDEYPIIEKWMVSDKPPKEIIQWDRRQDVIDCQNTAMCFYCTDYKFTPILNNPKKYLEKLKKYEMVIGVDPSPFDNMPITLQKSQIYQNLAITFYFGLNGIKIIPNVRIGDDRTLSCLEAFPKNTLIAVGTHGFIHQLENRYIFANQLMKVIDTLEPTGIVIYGPDIDEIFNYAKLKGIPLYQYDSYTMKQNKKSYSKSFSEDAKHER